MKKVIINVYALIGLWNFWQLFSYHLLFKKRNDKGSDTIVMNAAPNYPDLSLSKTYGIEYED